ncbi:hypothetical protein J3F84DRAFT_401105 [Trichoderma pleuroticola]
MGMPRERAMPLVPEPFSRVTISRQSLFLRNTSMAKIWAEFCPNLNIPQYRESLSKEKQEELDKRASTLRKRAISNHYFASSEFCWEVSAWNDVFGLLYDDERFRMSYDDFFLQRGYICSAPDCKDDHATMQPDKRLSDHDLRSMMCDPECGLIVDGTWGKTELLFPFAVYEAKKRATNYGQAEDQIYHACRTYLAMLDDLARNPDNVAEYQTEESSKYQLFAFTSCGSYWQVFMAWNMLHDCMVETIWEGDVKEFMHHHRPFVMKHLEAWHTRHQKMIQAAKGAIRKTNATPAYMDIPEDDSDKVDSNPLDGGNTSLDPHPDSDVKDFDVNNVDRFEQLVYLDYSEPAEWFLLKLRTDITRRDMSNETRRRNRSLREAARASEAAKETAKTPARGRPRKNKVTKSTKSPKQGRPRGRPPKAKVTRNGNTST